MKGGEEFNCVCRMISQEPLKKSLCTGKGPEGFKYYVHGGSLVKDKLLAHVFPSSFAFLKPSLHYNVLLSQ